MKKYDFNELRNLYCAIRPFVQKTESESSEEFIVRLKKYNEERDSFIENKLENQEDVLAFSHLPESLAKSCWDHFDYALGLKNGLILRFSEATYDPNKPDWIRLTAEKHNDEKNLGTSYSFDRSVDVRISEIAWCADAPMGS